ncbi:MAG: DUF5320 domain-containing protein [Elusimicrobiota bacterium]
MPNRDQTGPKGEGPLTGRGMGPCSIEDSIENSKKRQDSILHSLGLGRGRGPGRGRGRGYGRKQNP